MVRERVVDSRPAWRSVSAAVIAGLLVISPSQTGITAATFDAEMNRLVPAPALDPEPVFW